MNFHKHNGAVYSVSRKRPSDQKRGGFSLIELLVVVLIVISMLTVGQGFAKLCALEDRNREKAVTLEKLCDRVAWTQPYVAVGCGASNAVVTQDDIATQIDIAYTNIVSGIACETNRFAQVTNCTIRVRSDGVLQTVIESGKVTGLKSTTNTMDWMDALFIKRGKPALASCTVAKLTDYLVMRYEVTNVYADTVEMNVSGFAKRVDIYTNVVLTVPVKLRNAP